VKTTHNTPYKLTSNCLKFGKQGLNKYQNIQFIGEIFLINIKIKSLVGLLLIVGLLASAVALMPVNAKNLNLPDGANNIIYMDGAGIFKVPLIKPFPTNMPGTAQYMQVAFGHVKMPNSDLSFDQITIFFYMQTTKPDGTLNPPSLQPFAVITTNAQDQAFERIVWANSLVKYDATLIGLPASYSTDNVIKVHPEDLKVERRGNSVSVCLNEPQQLERPNGPASYFTLPAFSASMEKIGGSVHQEMSKTFTGYIGASGYTLVIDQMGFNGQTTFSSTGLLTGATFESFISMNQINTYYPPA
jgi:hypothetical protein